MLPREKAEKDDEDDLQEDQCWDVNGHAPRVPRLQHLSHLSQPHPGALFFRILPGRWIFDPSIRLMRSLLQRAQQVTAYWRSLQYHFFDFQDPVSIPKIFLPPFGI